MSRVVTHLTIHHTAGPGGPGDEQMAAIRRYHVEDRGWDDIAYHFLIDEKGHVWPGRSPDLDPDSHTDGDFSGHLFVALMGNFEEHEPTPEQVVSLEALVRYLRTAYGIAVGRVGTHRDYADTLCPGKNLLALNPEGTEG